MAALTATPLADNLVHRAIRYLHVSAKISERIYGSHQHNDAKQSVKWDVHFTLGCTVAVVSMPSNASSSFCCGSALPASTGAGRLSCGSRRGGLVGQHAALRRLALFRRAAHHSRQCLGARAAVCFPFKRHVGGHGTRCTAAVAGFQKVRLPSSSAGGCSMSFHLAVQPNPSFQRTAFGSR